MTLRLLVIDDSSLQRRAIATLLQPYDCQIEEAADGAAGLQAVRTSLPDLVLLDYNMPVLDGIGFLRELRADPSIAHLAVVMLTANEAPSTLAAAARLRVRDYLLKPCDGATLIAKLSRLVPLKLRDERSTGTSAP
jgi:two-component system chemotaxis response regulator CheY